MLDGHDARLSCEFDMEGGTLYSVKWYKDDNEFYRYAGTENKCWFFLVKIKSLMENVQSNPLYNLFLTSSSYSTDTFPGTGRSCRSSARRASGST